jgi:hypothetical protein
MGLVERLPDQYASNATTVVPSIKCIPLALKINLKPSTKVHRIRHWRNFDVTQITSRIPSWNVQAAAKRNRQMREVSTHADLFPESV